MKSTDLAQRVELLLVVLLSVTGSSEQVLYQCNPSVTCGCSRNSASVTRIVGGEPAASNTWSWAVSLLIGGSLCGGSILTDSWVVTAAHCLLGNTISQVRVYAGSTIRFAGTQNRSASRIILHPRYDPETFENDIALIQLASPLNMSDPNVTPICLPNVNSSVLAAGEWPPANTSVVAVGWGRLKTNGSLPSSLQQVTVQTVDYRTTGCQALVTNWKTQLCAGVPGSGKDTCQGDSGGPLMMFNANRQWVLIGLTSTGADCASAIYPGIYTRMVGFQGWMQSVMNTGSKPSVWNIALVCTLLLLAFQRRV